MQLYEFQAEEDKKIQIAWKAHRNVLEVMPTGGGKTILFSHIVQQHPGVSCVIAHRQELVSQISLALAKYGVLHRIIAPENTIFRIMALHVQHLGRHFYDNSAPCAVAGVDTLLHRTAELATFLSSTTLWVIDEGHHVTRKNKWGCAVALFTHPDVRGLGVTATPCRADGKGLGRHADGVYDTMCLGPPPAQLLQWGYLSKYTVFCPPSDLDLTGVPVGGTGDYSLKILKQREQASHIIGDVVAHYLRFAPGKQGLTFVSNLSTAEDIRAQYVQHGVKAEIISSKTPPRLRVETRKRFERKQIQQIISVDIFGEGVDIPSVEVISMARATQSLGLYLQQFGRVLRICEGKARAIVIDHVGNVMRHRLPDSPRSWTLDRRERRTQKTQGIPLKVCPQCTQPYEAVHPACPYCGFVIVPAERSKPEFVDGDLLELDATVLAALLGAIARVDAPEAGLRTRMQNAGAGHLATAGACKNHRLRQDGQHALREAMAWWAGHHTATRSEMYRRFYHTFGVDTGNARTLGRREAAALTLRINQSIDAMVNAR